MKSGKEGFHAKICPTARLDAPGVLHHVMIRGIEGRDIFNDNKENGDRLLFLNRLPRPG
jgi:hypothetical protein